MPTLEEMGDAISKIERVLSEHPRDRMEQFSQLEPYYGMEGHLWPGFRIEEQFMVVGRVLSEEPKEFWMNGLDRRMSRDEIEATAGWKNAKAMEHFIDFWPERDIESYYDSLDEHTGEYYNRQEEPPPVIEANPLAGEEGYDPTEFMSSAPAQDKDKGRSR
jgi:hypothetical protein